MMGFEEIKEEQFAKDTLERYSGSSITDFQPHLLLTNFPRYVDHFATLFNVPVHEGSMFKVAHDKVNKVSILDFKIGSTAAALVIDLCSFLKVDAALLLGMCGGLRRRYQIGDYFVPIAGIRGEGTSEFYFPKEVPALANFMMQRAVTDVLDEMQVLYHTGITYTTNWRFWEFNSEFVEKVKATKAQAYELECATLFIASYKRKFTLGALLLVSDLPLKKDGVKTKRSSDYVYENFMEDHLLKGIAILKKASMIQKRRTKKRSSPSE